MKDITGTVLEVYSSLLELNGNKAVGTDGFSLNFWQLSYDLVKNE